MNQHTDIFQLPTTWTKEEIEEALADILTKECSDDIDNSILNDLQHVPYFKTRHPSPFRRTTVKTRRIPRIPNNWRSAVI
ncbi:MAG: hypothetical protein E6R04_02785 [Spirochaetes bacterium]|nr:MAG: hypothetical protein E6R04_02785 [Spirochaetota bacterium]